VLPAVSVGACVRSRLPTLLCQLRVDNHWVGYFLIRDARLVVLRANSSPGDRRIYIWLGSLVVIQGYCMRCCMPMGIDSYDMWRFNGII